MRLLCGWARLSAQHSVMLDIPMSRCNSVQDAFCIYFAVVLESLIRYTKWCIIIWCCVSCLTNFDVSLTNSPYLSLTLQIFPSLSQPLLASPSLSLPLSRHASRLLLCYEPEANEDRLRRISEPLGRSQPAMPGFICSLKCVCQLRPRISFGIWEIAPRPQARPATAERI
jgi:hypothetical protein